MQTYPIPMVPGPTSVHPEVLKAYQTNFGSSDFEPEFLALYNQVEARLQQVYNTRSSVVTMTGEGMIVLWGALKSCIKPGERVLAIGTGLFGFGVGEMAAAIGAEVKSVGFEYNQTINDWAKVEEAIATFKPKMITVIHCETPSGTLNPIAELGALKEKYQVPLLYVDVVASLGGAPVLTDEWQIDLCLGGAQKAISVPAGTSFLTVSPRAWEIVEAVGYVGYDALQPFRSAQRDFYFPYTPYWHGMAALNKGLELLLAEGLANSYKRHVEVATYCRQRLVEIGLQLYPALDAIQSPTVTAVNVPAHIPWKELDGKFREQGLVVGGNYGPLASKVFRLGHMGTQANLELVQKALDVIESVMKGA
jgi:aspartate aminotransferase-like enzyme